MWMWMFNCCKWLEIPIHHGFTQLLHRDSRLGVAGLRVWGAFSARPHCKCRDCIEVWGRTYFFSAFPDLQTSQDFCLNLKEIWDDVWMFFFTLWEDWENIGWFWSSKGFQMGGLGLSSVASVLGSFGGWALALKVSRLWRVSDHCRKHRNHFRTSFATMANKNSVACCFFLLPFTEGFDTKTRSFRKFILVFRVFT